MRLSACAVVLFGACPLVFAAPVIEGEADADAEEAASGEESRRRLPKLQVTATRRAESTLDVPVATTVVDRESIRAAAPQTAMDALHGEPGTFVQQTTPGQAVVIVRGLKGSEVLHLVDGFRLNNAIFRNAPNQYVALVDGQMLERIEVVRGPMSTLYGGDAMGGVVQMLSAEPRFEGPAWQYRAGLRTTYASADHSLLTRAEGGAGNADLVVSGGVTYQDVGTLRLGGGERLPHTGFRAHGGDLKLVVHPADGHELSFSAQVFEQPKTPRVDELVAGFGQARPNSSTFLFEPQEREFYHLRYRYQGSALFDTVEVQLGRQKIDDDRRTRDFGSVNEERERNADTTLGASVQVGRRWDTHFLTAGGEYYDDTVDSFRVRRNIVSAVQSERPARFPDGSTMRQFGLFVADDWTPLPWLDVNGGLRYSRIRTRLPPVTNAIGVALDDDDLSGNLGASIKLGERARLVANLGRGFRAPNVFDLGTFGDRPGNRFNQPNADLQPETVLTGDLGIKFEDDRLEAELVGFVSDYDDKITPVLTGATTSSGRLVVESRNATRLLLRGFESGLRYRIGPTLSAYATATCTRGEEQFDGDEYPADRIPPLFGKIGAEWQVREHLRLDLFVFYAAAQDRLSPRDAIDPRINPAGTAGWATVNARAAWRVAPQLDLAVRLENIGDRRYREHGSGLDEPGRNAMVTLDWRF